MHLLRVDSKIKNNKNSIFNFNHIGTRIKYYKKKLVRVR